MRRLLLVISLTLLACGAPAELGGRASHDGGLAPTPTSQRELCDGYDNNLDGDVDEGCACSIGASAECYPGPPGPLAGVGICKKGIHVCVGSENEFGTWGACEGYVAPTAEQCGNGIDEDCDGADLPCAEAPAPPSVSVTDAGPAPTPDATSASKPDSFAPPPPQPPAPQPPPPPPPPLKVPLFFIGDCVTASCPASHPFPVGCQVIFSPGDSRGCVANAPGSSLVYFQAGDECDKGLVTGFLLCDTKPGAALNLLNCPMIGKTKLYYPTSKAGCPPVH